MDYTRLEVRGVPGNDDVEVKRKVPNRGANPYVDDYVGFTWNNIHSSTYNCFIENTGHLEFVGAPDFSNNFVSPAFQTRTYYTGMQNGSKKFNLNLVFYQLTLKELNAAFHWLDRTLVSDFYFDYEPYWKYSCKLASIGTIEKYVVGRTMYRGRPADTYLCRVAVQFETVYHPEAISSYEVCKYTGDDECAEDYSKQSGAPYLAYSDYITDYSATTNLIDSSEAQLLDDNGSVLQCQSQSEPGWYPLIRIIQPDPPSMLPQVGYWRFILQNPSAHPTYFKLHFYNVTSMVTVYEYWNHDYFNSGLGNTWGGDNDLDAYENSACICNINLSLDSDITLDLHYNSEDGTVLCANQLIEQLRSNDAKIPCIYKASTANVYIPGTNDPDQPASIAIEVTILPREGVDPQLMIEYDTYEYMI